MAFFWKGFKRHGRLAAFKPSGEETASASHRTVNTRGHASCTVVVDVTATAGTPTLLVVVEGSVDGGATWTELGRIGDDGYSVGPLAAPPSTITGTGTHRGVYPVPQWVRTRSVVGGTGPSVTYSVHAQLK